jgi:maltose alpha-D-glucosyltransferase/alpha-amylase
MPGVPLLVYGDEIGMGDDLTRPEREAVRAPMQWNAGPFGAFSGRAPHEIVNPVIDTGPFAFERVNVEAQLDDEESLLRFVQALCEVRRRRPWLGLRDLEANPVEQENERVLAFEQRHQNHCLLTLHNFSSQSQTVTLTGSGTFDRTPLLSSPGSETASEDEVVLGPFGFLWLERGSD